MPEIKNTFSQGKMNKDLDERLVPSGQYRHAENIDVSNSESSDTGVVENILGNAVVGGNILSEGQCVGSISNEQTNKLYWFVKLADRDVIAEYDHDTQLSRFIAIDLGGENAFLKFTGAYITAINIIDDFIFWTDGNSEPKKINIEETASQIDSQNIDLHSRLYVDGIDKGPLKEDYVTVIRKKPSMAPTVKMNSSKGKIGSEIFEKIFPRFCFRYKYRDGEYSALGPFTDIVFNPEYPINVNVNNSYNVDEPYNKSMLNLIESVDLYDFIPHDIPSDVVQVDLLYKQENSAVVYSIANIKYTDPEWSEKGSDQFWDKIYNDEAIAQGDPPSFWYGSDNKGKYTVSTENIHAALPSDQMLRPWDNVPKKALAQEVVGNRIVYGNYTQGYDFGVDQEGNYLKPAVYSDYHYRGDQNFSDGGLRSLKSTREYQVGVVYGDEYGRETPVFTSADGSVKIDWLDDQLGKLASASTMACASASFAPNWAHYYKFYIKQTSGEYYNLVMDKVYVPPKHVDFHDDNDHVWISFASSDRNKIVEEDFIIAKKIFDSSGSTQISENNRYKILDISNNAPDAVKYTFSPLGIASNANTSTPNILAGATSGLSVFEDPDRRIDKQTNNIIIDRDAWLNMTVAGSLLSFESNQDPDIDVFLSWERLGNHSKRYKVSSIYGDGGNTDSDEGDYIIKLTSTITEHDASIAADEDGNNNQLHEALVFKVEKRDKRPPEEFSGKFFVKIKDNPDLLTFEDPTAEDQLFVSATIPTFWLYGYHNPANDFEVSTGGGQVHQGIVNVDSPPNPPSVTVANYSDAEATVTAIVDGTNTSLNLPSEWSNLFDLKGQCCFIDNLPFVASNPKDNGEWYAKESGEGWFGAMTKYETYSWLGQIVGFPDYDDSETNIFEDDDGYQPWNDQGETYYTWKVPLTSGGRGLAPLVFLSQVDPGWNIVNGLEGIVTTTDYHTSGPRRWLQDSIYSNMQAEYTYGEPGQEGKHFIHISFLAPGVDLHDGNWGGTLEELGVEMIGRESIAKYLQGIWGGGIFTKTPANALWPGLAAAEAPAFVTIGGVDINWVEFEGNYDEEGLGRDTAPGPLQGQGYNNAEDYGIRHIKQWDPSYSDQGHDDAVHAFVTKLGIPQNKFRFNGDNEVYTILNTTVKRIYNHTPWRMRWMFNGLEYVSTGISVEEAASDWAVSMNDNGAETVTGASWSMDADLAAELQTTIENFGAAHNRRVCYIIEVDKDPTDSIGNIDLSTSVPIEFVSEYPVVDIDKLVNYPTIWETEPAQGAELNIYYEASNNIPTRITPETAESFAPLGCVVTLEENPNDLPPGEFAVMEDGRVPGLGPTVQIRRIAEWAFDAETGQPRFRLNQPFPVNVPGNDEVFYDYDSALVRFTRDDGSYTIIRLVYNETDASEYGNPNFRWYIVNELVDTSLKAGLSWYNCFSFGDGIESNRIRDGFNEMVISNGAKASATLEEPYSEETRKSGMIYSGIYNSNSGVNNLNQFIQAQKITKDLNPTYGSIQKLFTRSTDLVALCEDRIIKVLANKDALFNADGNPQLVATENVLGQAVPFSGDYGISKNPESFSSETYRAYFTDKQRGAVLRLSMDGLTPISDAGMRDWFRDNLSQYETLLGTYDSYSKQYNITLDKDPQLLNNLLKNSSFNFGEQLTSSDPLSALTILEGSSPIITGDNFSSSLDNIGARYALAIQDENSPYLPLDNMSLNTFVTIRNHAAIPINSLVLPQDGQDGWDYIDPVYVNFTLEDVLEELDETTASNVDEGFVFLDYFYNNTDGDTFTAGVGGGLTNAKAYFERRIVDLTTDPYTYIVPYPGENLATYDWGFTEANWGYGSNLIYMSYNDIPTSNTINSGVRFRGLVTGRYYSMRGPYWSNENQGYTIVEDGVANWPHDEPNVNNVDFSNTQNNTIFAGEEIRIVLQAATYNEYYNADGVNLGETDPDSTNNPRIRITLLDGGTPLNNGEVYIPEYNGEIAMLNNVPEEEQTPFNVFHSWHGTTSPTAYLGPSDYTVTWGNSSFSDSGSLQFRSANFKFTIPDADGNPTTNQGIAVQDLRVVLTIDTYGVTNPRSCYISRFSIHKFYKLQQVELPGQTYIPEVLGFPVDNVEGWSEVIHPQYIDGGWGSDGSIEGNNGVNFNFGTEDAYGPSTGNINEVSYTNPLTGDIYKYLEPTPNGITGFPGNAEGLPSYGIDPQEGQSDAQYYYNVNGAWYNSPSQQDINVSAEDSITRVTSNDPGGSVFITQTLEEPLQADRWYLLDVNLKMTSTAPLAIDMNNTTIANVLDSTIDWSEYDGFDVEDMPGFDGFFGSIKAGNNGIKLKAINTQGYEYNNIDPTLPPYIGYRAIFKLTENSAILNDPYLFKLGSYGDDFTASSITLIDITHEAAGGIAEEWYTPPINYLGLGTPSLQQVPTVWYNNGKINWDTEDSDNKYVEQRFGVPEDATGSSHPAPEEEPDGFWELSFEVMPVSSPSYGSSGSLRGYVASAPDEDGNFYGFGFTGINETSTVAGGIYTIKGNFNDTSDVEIYTGNGSSIASGGVTPVLYTNPDVTVGKLSELDFMSEVEGTPHSRVYFAPDDNGCKRAIRNVTLKNRTTYYMGGGVDDWSILNVDQETDPIIYWQEGTLFFNNAPEIYTDLGLYADLLAQGGPDLAFTLFPQVCQEIEGNFFEGDTLHLEFDYDISDGDVEVYYRGVAGNPIGFSVVIEGPAFGTFSEDIVLESTIGTPMQNIAYVRGNLGIKSDDSNGFAGSIDNISLTRVVHDTAVPQTVSFSEDVTGWVSFKSFIPQSGLSLSNQYFTISDGSLYQHNIGTIRNSFYGQVYPSIVETVLNAEPSSIKDFNTINYEGSQSRIMPYSTSIVEDADGNQTTISNLSTYNAITEQQRGWYSSSIYTDYETGSIQEFIEKEGKWFNYIRGTNAPDVSNFNFQGLGIASDIYIPTNNTAE